MNETHDKMSYPEKLSYSELLAIKVLPVTEVGTRYISHVAFCDLAVPVDMCEMQTKTQI